MSDIVARPYGSLCSIVYQSAVGRSWLLDNADWEDWQALDNGFLCDYRMSSAIINAAEDEGLSIGRGEEEEE